MYYYSPSTGSFYNNFSANKPSDAILLTQQQYNALVNGETVEGLDVVISLDGEAVLTVLPIGIFYYYGVWQPTAKYTFKPNNSFTAVPVVLYKGIQYVAVDTPTLGIEPHNDIAWKPQSNFFPIDYKGAWDANANTPPLVNGIGTAGDFYRCVVPGTVNFGAGDFSFQVGDIVIYNGTEWSNGGILNNTDNIFLPFNIAPIDLPIDGGESLTTAIERAQGQINNRQVLIQPVTADNIATIDATGQTQDSGIAFSTDPTLSANSNMLSSTQAAIKTYVDTTTSDLGATKQNLISPAVANDVVLTDSNGQTFDSGKQISTDPTLGGNTATDNFISTQLAVKSYTDAQDATKQDLIIPAVAGDFVYVNLAGQVYDSGISLSTDTSLGGASPSNLLISTQLAIKSYVDAVAQGLSIKDPAIVATSTNIALAGLQTIDGIVLTAGNRVLVKSQTDNTQNGIYSAASGTWTRTNDADGWDDLVGAFILVQQGNLYANTQWVSTIGPTGTVGTDPITFAQFGGMGTYTAGVGLELNGTQFLIANTTVPPGAYGQADSTIVFTVNAQGQLTNASVVPILVTPTQAGLSNVPNTNATDLANDLITGTFTPVNSPILTGQSGNQAFANTQGQLNNKQNLIVTPIANDFTQVDATGQTFDSGLSFSTDGTLAANSNVIIVSEQAIKTYVDNRYTADTGLTLNINKQFSITPTGVTANTYGAANSTLVLNINAQGQIVSATATLINITPAQAGLGNVPNVDATNLANDMIQGTFTLSNTPIVTGDNGLVIAQKTQGQLNNVISNVSVLQTNAIQNVNGITGNTRLNINTINPNVMIPAATSAGGITTQQINFSTTPSFISASLTANINQLVLGTTNTTTVTMAPLSANRIFTLPDANSNPIQPKTAVTSQWLKSVDDNGLFISTQPLASDVLIDPTFAVGANTPIVASINSLVGFQRAQGQIQARLAVIQDAQGNNWSTTFSTPNTTAIAPNTSSTVSGLIRAGGTALKQTVNSSLVWDAPLSQSSNLLINAAFNIWQRGTSFAITTQVKNTYTADRWACDTLTGAFVGTINISRNTWTNFGSTPTGTTQPPGKYFMTCQVASYTSGTWYMYQCIEQVNIASNEPITITLQASSNATSQNFVIELVQFFGTGGSPSASVITSVGTFVSSAVGVIATAFTVIVPSVQGKTWGTNLDDCLVVRIRMPNTVSFHFLGKMQVQRGTVSTIFDTIPAQIDLANCMRYCQSVTTLWSGQAVGTNVYSTNVNYPVPLRTAYTLLISSASNGAVNFSSTTGITQNQPGYIVDSRTAAAGLGALGSFSSTYLMSSELTY